jgi:hypothetical protein
MDIYYNTNLVDLSVLLRIDEMISPVKIATALHFELGWAKGISFLLSHSIFAMTLVYSFNFKAIDRQIQVRARQQGN